MQMYRLIGFASFCLLWMAGCQSSSLDTCSSDDQAVHGSAQTPFSSGHDLQSGAMGFDFANSNPSELHGGWMSVAADQIYDPAIGYGFEDLGLPDLQSFDHTAVAQDFIPMQSTGVLGDHPFRFSVKIPEGNYKVSLLLGDLSEDKSYTIKAESRRLIVQDFQTKAGESEVLSFYVNTRTRALKDGGQVRTNSREEKVYHWDEKLTIEFNGTSPSVSAMLVEPAPEIPVVYLIGDSTVTDQADEPWCGWGQMLPVFLSQKVAVSNHAESGRTVSSFFAERRYNKIMDTLKAGDYVLIQFGHNDMKEKGEGKGPFLNYAQGLTRMVQEIKAKGAHPVLVTSMHRRWFENGVIQDTLGDYPVAMRQVAEAQDVPLVDLHAMSELFYNAMGPEASSKAFVHYPANTFPHQEKALKDNTHHNAYGAYVLALCVLSDLQKQGVDFFINNASVDLIDFDPAHPPEFGSIHITPSPLSPKSLTPEGS